MNDSDQAGATPQKIDVSAQTDVPTDVMEPVKKADALIQTEEMTDILAILECPVCLEDIQASPIYICENAQGHSVCDKCHKTLKNERKPCPTCKQPLADRRSLLGEKLLEKLLKKCRFDGCSFKASTRAPMEKHEEDWHRLIPCAYCDDKIGVKGLGEHLEKEHDQEQFTYKGLSEVNGFGVEEDCRRGQKVWVEEGGNCTSPQFVYNWLTFNEGSKMCWLSFLGPKASAKRYKYTVRVKASLTSKKYLLECTKLCEPCDLSHKEVEKEMCAVILPKKLIKEAAEGDKENNCLWFEIVIQKA